MKDFLWTFIVEHSDGYTLVEQVNAVDLDTAIGDFNRSKYAIEHGLKLDCSKDNPFIEDVLDPILIEGMHNVWWLSELDPGNGVSLANVVKTLR